jgi:hypothetical protein
MNKLTLIIFLICSSAYAQQAELRLGSKDGDNRIFLYREPVAIGYWNNWSGVALIVDRFGSVDVNIRGEGKSASFDGNISINCRNGKFYWTAVPKDKTLTWTSVSEIPDVVVQNTYKIFCKK